MLVQSRVIAKGKRIRDLARLLQLYGGQSSKWVKKSSPLFEDNAKHYEYHWYEQHGVGRFEIKLKEV